MAQTGRMSIFSRLWRHGRWLSGGLALAVCLGSPAAMASSCLDQARRAEQAFGIPDMILQSIVMQESGNNPLALNADGEAIYPATQEEARMFVRNNIAALRNIDIGCGQISMKYHGEFFRLDLDMAFDPWINMVYASNILLHNYRQYGDWTSAVAHYHSPDAARQSKYVCQIMKRMASLKGRSYQCQP